MQLSLAEAKHILEAKKELFNPHPWSPVNNSAGSTPLSFSARVRLDGGAHRGLWFRASTFAHNPSTGTFLLSIEQRDVRSHLLLYRLDWRPFRDHFNGPDGPEELKGLRFKEGVTHEHSCLFDADEKGNIRSGNLPTAQFVTPDPDGFQEALTYVCATLSIMNQNDIPPAPTQGRMV
jgi:hypothetical protein